MRKTVLALLFMLAVAPLHAQRTAVAVDRRAYPELGPEFIRPAELDGNPLTREFYQERSSILSNRFEVRGLALRDGRLCVGQWFAPAFTVALLPGDAPGLAWVQNYTDGGKTRVLVSGVFGYYEIEIGYGC